ncbi:MAG: T9SS type A sorting domain-containing protein [Bacteroidales bacterium]
METKKTYIFILILILIGSFTAKAQFAGGSGTEADPYQVSNPSELNEVRNHLGSHFIQTNDINLRNYDHDNDGKGWLPLGGSGSTDRFYGHYNGQGHVIYDLRIDRPLTNNIGLFGHVGVDDDVTEISITNVGLINAEVAGARGVGALAGRVTANQHTKIEYAWVRSSVVTGDGAIGGLVGSNNSHRSTANSDGYKPRISKSFAITDVYWSENNTGDKFGGLAGCTQKGIIINSYARGSVNVDNTTAQISSVERVGGLVGCGLQRAEIFYSYSSSLVNVPASNPSVTNVGGLLGTYDGNTTLVSAYWDTETSGWNTSPGGEGETTADMNTQSTFVDYDFTGIWGIDPSINDGYPYLLSDYTGILPVSLKYFTAKPADNGIELLWETASETNNDYFTIEKSTDGKVFVPVVTIDGAGNSKRSIEYTYFDNVMAEEQIYYRLKQTDFDGQYSYSPTQIIQRNDQDNTDAELYPNPNRGDFTLKHENNGYNTFRIISIDGRMIHQGQLEPWSTQINMPEVSKGTYYFQAEGLKPIRFIVR